MKKKIIILVSVIIMVIIAIVTIYSKSNIIKINNYIRNDNKKPKYELYINCLGNIQYVKIFKLTTEKIEYKIKRNQLLKQGLCGDFLTKSINNKVYFSIYRQFSIFNFTESLTNKMLIFKNGNIIKTKEFSGNYGTCDMLMDYKKGLAYITFALQPASYNLQGRPYKIFSLNDESIIKSFALKGHCYTYDILDNNIYVYIDAVQLGYKDTPDFYLATIDRDNQKIKIINSNFIRTGCMKISPLNKKIYAENKNKITVFDKYGKHLKDIILKKDWVKKIIFDREGYAYITHQNLLMQDDNKGNTLTILNSRNDEIVKELLLPDGCGSMDIVDNYLFVASSGDKKVITIIDIKIKSIIGYINCLSGDSIINGICALKYDI